MNQQPNSPRAAYKGMLQGAFLTVLTLFGGMLLGVVGGNVVFGLLPGHNVASPSSLHVLLAAIPGIAGFLAGSAAWGWAMGRIARSDNRRRMAIAGMLGFVPITLLMAYVLLRLEPLALESLGEQIPIQRLFTLFFVPTAFIISAVSAAAIGLGMKRPHLAWKMGASSGLAAAAAFLIVNWIMEAAGWVVGAPQAAERFTMLTVMFVGDLGSALAGGGVMGWILANSVKHPE